VGVVRGLDDELAHGVLLAVADGGDLADEAAGLTYRGGQIGERAGAMKDAHPDRRIDAVYSHSLSPRMEMLRRESARGRTP
jgi:hypothetical protein